MPSLLDTFRFIANDGTGNTTVRPVVSGLKLRKERIDKEKRAHRVRLITPLVFRGSDYTYFRDIYDAGDCTEVTLLIERYCGGAWETYYQGIVPIPDGDYNASACTVTFEVKPDDVYECANKGFEKKANWLEYATATEIKTYVTGSTIEQYPVTVIVPSALTAMKWAFTIIDVRDNPDPDPITAFRPITNVMVINPSQTKIITTLAREKVTAASSPGPGWINISGTTWARPAIVGKITTTGIFKWSAEIINPSPVSNGRKLETVLNEAVAALDCGIDQVVSNFLGINPDGSAPTNDAYTYATTNLQDLFFFQKSDIVRASASNDATRFETTIREFLAEIAILNTDWVIVNDGGTIKLRIEHYTYFDGSNGLDLTTLEGGKYIAGLDRFKAVQQIPAFEEFAYQESYRQKFQRQRIDYPANCVNSSSIDHSTRLLCADYSGLLENQDAGLEGFFLMATHESGGVFYLNTLGGEANGALCFEQMIPALWADGRYHADATATVTGYTVNSTRKTRQQGPITIKCPCATSLDFDPSKLIHTQIGWGEVDTAEEDTERGTLQLQLLQ